eukprot:TRINITY_DN16398_c0_g1_i2.p1 TRINITY_DN16398_c0_g1~~TRINITY_DN16398_c0_g1_i2.p1  ORF type:complete len:139 (+),score=27.67 TRINITY_DN16398_c0_g1_i2:334-750(+)
MERFGRVVKSLGPQPDLAKQLRRIPLQPRPKGFDSSQSCFPGEEGFEPQWTGDYLELVNRQAHTDPDSIFGSQVPACDLEDIFPNHLFREAGMPPSKKLKRSDSGDWELDALARTEVLEYKRRMGHTKTWKDLVDPAK